MTTIRDVAKYTGVAPITVSRVVNGSDQVRPETRELVLQAIRDLGYVPNLAARSLRSRQTMTLALILPDITNVFWTTAARGVEDAAQDGGYSVMLCNTDEDPQKFSRYLNMVIQQRVDGVLVAPYSTDREQLCPLVEMKIPTVVLDRRVDAWDGDSVTCDSIAGALALTQHLIGLGHRRIGMVAGPAATSTSEDRVAGYRLALHKAGIPLEHGLIRRGEFRESSGQAMTAGLLDDGMQPSAIIAANNVLASGVMEELRARGISIPAQVALACFDEVPEVERRFPFLTNVAQPAYEIGVRGVELLVSRLSAPPDLAPRRVVLPTILVLRYSCGRFLHTPGPAAQMKDSLIPDATQASEVAALSMTDRRLLQDLGLANVQ